MADAWEDKNIKTKDAWDDEEEDNDVKDEWDAPDPEPAKPAPKPVVKLTKAVVKPKKDVADMTEEEKLQAQLDADFENAKELLGLEQSLDEVSFASKEDYRNYIQRFLLRINTFSVGFFNVGIRVCEKRLEFI
jgi:hypothetical protein